MGSVNIYYQLSSYINCVSNTLIIEQALWQIRNLLDIKFNNEGLISYMKGQALLYCMLLIYGIQLCNLKYLTFNKRLRLRQRSSQNKKVDCVLMVLR